MKDTYGEKPVIELEGPSACSGVYFHCPLIGPEVLPKAEMKQRIKEFLYAQLEEEKGLTACLIIHTFAKDSEKVTVFMPSATVYCWMLNSTWDIGEVGLGQERLGWTSSSIVFFQLLLTVGSSQIIDSRTCPQFYSYFNLRMRVSFSSISCFNRRMRSLNPSRVFGVCCTLVSALK